MNSMARIFIFGILFSTASILVTPLRVSAQASCACTCQDTAGQSFGRGTVTDQNACKALCARERGALDLPLTVKSCELVKDGKKDAVSAATPTIVGFGTNPLCPAKGPCDLPSIIGRVIRGLLGIVGTIALLMFVYGGFTWMTAGGEPEKIKKAKGILVWSTLGLVVIFSSYVIVNFIIEQVVK